MDGDTFRKYFILEKNLSKFFTAPRWGEVNEKDLFYCSLRALIKSLSSDKIITLETYQDEQTAAIMNLMVHDVQKDVTFAPAQVNFLRSGLKEMELNEVYSFFQQIREDEGVKKVELVKGFKAN